MGLLVSLVRRRDALAVLAVLVLPDGREDRAIRAGRALKDVKLGGLVGRVGVHEDDVLVSPAVVLAEERQDLLDVARAIAVKSLPLPGIGHEVTARLATEERPGTP